MRISEIVVLPGDDPVLATFDVMLERPYFAGGKKNGDIMASSYVNLHTKNSISFTKGLVLKKHLITKRPSDLSANAAGGSDEDDDEANSVPLSVDGSAATSAKSK